MIQEISQRFMDITRDGVYRYTFADGRILLANAGLVRILDLDCTPEDLVGRCLNEVLICTEEQGTVRHALENKGEIHGFEYHFRTLKGVDRWVIHDSMLVVDRVTGQRVVDAIVKDITERKLAEMALRRSESLLHDMGAMAGVGGWEVDVATGAQQWTDEVYRIHEVDPSTFQPTAAEGFRFYAPSARPIIEKAFQRTIDCGEPYDLELEFITAKGNKRWVHTMGRASREDGKTRMVAGTFQDITARKQAEDELRTYRLHLEELVEQRTAELQKSNEALACEVENRKGVEAALRSANEHLDSLFNYANAPIIVWDSEYRITRFNHAFELLTGKCADDVLGKSLEMLFPSDRVAASMVLIRKALEGERWESVEINIQHLDGTVRTLLWNSATVYAPDAKTPVATIAQGYDITERKRAEGALRESEDRFRATFEQAAVGIAQVGLDGRWLRVNQRLCDIVGYTREELLRFTFQDITHPDDLDSDLAFFRQVLAGEISTYSMEKRYYRKDRSLVWVNLTVGVVRDEEGTPQYFVSVVEDIAKRKQAEESLSTVMLDLERSNKDLEQFAYVASHDLQEPLRKVASFTQLLAERYADRLDADARQFIAYAVDGAHRMQRLINDLLAYSRVGTRGVRFAPVNCETVFAYAVANLEVAIKESGAVVTRDALPTVTGDEVQLVQLFQNLIGNGIKFHGVAPPCVHVSVTRQEKEWIFQVRDNGIGIDPQYFDRLFVIFQRLHAMAQYPGTGIGLAISKKVVERHGGRIWVESEPERGASFFFSIPIGEG